MMDKHRAIHWLTRLLALGITACGAVICYSGISFLSQSTQPYQENLRAIKGTIQELDATVVQLRNQSEAFNKYLEFLEASLAENKLTLDQIDKQSAELFDLVGTSSVKLLNESSTTMKDASEGIRNAADRAGKIPYDPLKEERNTAYTLSGHLTVLSSELKSRATDISGQVANFKKITSSSLASAKLLVKTTEPQIKLLRTGAFAHMPNLLGALSMQLAAHVKLIDSSYDLLMKVSLPVIAAGVGFMLIGIWGLLTRRSLETTSIPSNVSDPKP